MPVRVMRSDEKSVAGGKMTLAFNAMRDLAVTLVVAFIIVSTASREGVLRYSDAIRYDAWKWLRMIQP